LDDSPRRALTRHDGRVPSSVAPELSSVADIVRARRARLERDALLVVIDGAVSVGKSTTAAMLADLLDGPPDPLEVRVVSTDGFLFPNRILDARGLTMRKGFPESYDHDALAALVTTVRAGGPELGVPVYSHETYDVLDELQVFACPQVLVLEGVHTMLLADTVDLTVYVDAAEADIQRWFAERFVELAAAGTGFYAQFSSWPEAQLLDFARGVWDSINGPNLHEFILPGRDRADVVVTKGPDHGLVAVTLRD
jgi:type I pantothenate kinase